MNSYEFRQVAGDPIQHLPAASRPGDLVVPRVGYPTLCEVIAVEACGLLRVRGLAWEPGYSSVVLADDYVPASRILDDGRAAPAPALPQIRPHPHRHMAMVRRQRPRPPEPVD